jgi:hypothetical protein
VIGRLGFVGGMTSATLLLALTACGSDGPTPPPGGGGNGGGGNAGAAYAVKSDLCAEADLAPLKAVLPVVTDLKPQQLPRNGATLYACDGQAAKSDAYDDIGFISLSAYMYETPEGATRQYEESTGRSGVTDPQPVPSVGQKAVSYLDGPQVRVAVLDGTLYFSATWTSNDLSIPDGVRQALVDTTIATVAKLKT